MDKIPFCKTTLGEEEINAVAEVIRSGWVVMGAKTLEFEKKFAEYVGAKHAIFVDSCTSALDLSVKWHLHKGHIKHGAEAVVPSLTFTSSAEVLVNNGLKPHFIDVQEKYYTIRLAGSENLVMAVHLTGNYALVEGKHVIFDSAHRIEKDQCKGLEHLSCFSFYATKNMSTVQGGMIATNDDEVAEWLKKARDHGISKGTTERYKDGKWQYSIDFVGWREKSDDVHAAIGLVQLAKLPKMTERRNAIVAIYNSILGLNRKGNHLYPVLVDNRADFIDYMAQNGIQTSVHFLPLHKMPAYQKYMKGRSVIALANTDYFGDHFVSLPLYPDLTDEQVTYIAKKVYESKYFIRK